MKHLPICLLLLLAVQAKAQNRIVTAGSSSSEIVCKLGFCDNIIATDRTSTYPEHLQELPSIGYRTGIGAEGIIAQNPDLVILESGYVKEELIEQLKPTGITVLVLNDERTLSGMKKRIRDIAQAVGHPEKGEALISRLEGDLNALQQQIAGTVNRPRVIAVYARGQGNVQVAGRNSAFTILDISGVENAITELEGYKPLNTEELIQANPDYILFFQSGLQSIGGVDGALQLPGVAQTTAGKKRQIIAMNGVKLTSWGPRIVEAARELFLLTHPEAGNE